VIATIPHREVQLAVRTPDEPVQVVSDQRGLDAESGMQGLDRLGLSVVVTILDPVDRRNGRHVDRPLACLDPGDQPRGHLVPRGENLARIRNAIAIRVLENDQTIRGRRKTIRFRDLPGLDPLSIVGATVVDRS
jgi:hypothetical protein